MTRRILVNAAVLLVITSALLAAQHASQARTESAYRQIERFLSVRKLLVDQYVEEVNTTELLEGAIRGMIDTLEDPYTVYFDAEELQQFDADVNGEFVGVGAEVDLFKERLRIVSPLEDSPAWQAGVRSGDIVLEIDGEDTLGLSLPEAVKRLKGEAGTPVTILVRHRSGEEEKITIVRQLIQVPSVRGVMRMPDQHFDYMLDKQNKVGYVRLTQFGERSLDDLTGAIRELQDQGARALILDLRFNGGGLLQGAVGVSDLFLTEDQRVVSVKGRSTREQSFDSSDATMVPELPLVLLVNEASASASEIVAGALKDNDRALIVGTRTFGKGSVQRLQPLGQDLGALKLTSAYYFIPSGRKIHRVEDAEQWGVDPSPGSYVPMDPDAILAMLEVRREMPTDRLYEGRDADNPVTPDFLRETVKDAQLAAALEAAVGRLDQGQWPSVGQDNTVQVERAKRRATLERQLDALTERGDEIRQEIQKLDAGEPMDDEPAEVSADAEAPGDDDVLLREGPSEITQLETQVDTELEELVEDADTDASIDTDPDAEAGADMPAETESVDTPEPAAATP
ncbi:MAG: S41 family peptidase [Planctomycetota bacterium]